MNAEDLEIAKRLLLEKKLTLCVVKKQNVLVESRARGVLAFIDAVGELGNKLQGSSVADRVAGKAVALMCIHVKVVAVYATTLSATAKALFEKYSTRVEYVDLVKNVLRADRSSICPFEQLVSDVSDPGEGYKKLKSACDSKERL
jgi:hypothetical protein